MFSLADVAAHNTRSDCWMVIDGNVLDVTNFISQHPGGERILEGCGTDASTLFNAVQNHVSQAIGMLKTYQVGSLSQ